MTPNVKGRLRDEAIERGRNGDEARWPVEASGERGYAAAGRVPRAARGADTGEGGLGQRRREAVSGTSLCQVSRVDPQRPPAIGHPVKQ